jgi:nucleoside-diphosphate-sugar epimerase
MKILLTGGSGMVGRNILENKYATNHTILSPDSEELNLLSYSEVYNYINLNKPDIVIHAAGKVGGIQANIDNPISFLTDNMDMGKNIILASKQNNIKKLINLGTSCMYPKNAINPLKEEYILKGELEPTNEGYALSKIMVSKLCEYVNFENNNFSYKTIIPCNLYGKYDKFSPKNSHMLPAVIRKIDNAKMNNIDTVEIWGDGLAKREFMYAGDLADFIFIAISKFEKLPQNINVGFGVDYSINEYYKAIANVIGFDGDFVHDLSKPIGMKQKLMDSSLVNSFGWKPTTNLLEGIKKTYNFYKKTN